MCNAELRRKTGRGDVRALSRPRGPLAAKPPQRASCKHPVTTSPPPSSALKSGSEKARRENVVRRDIRTQRAAWFPRAGKNGSRRHAVGRSALRWRRRREGMEGREAQCPVHSRPRSSSLNPPHRVVRTVKYSLKLFWGQLHTRSHHSRHLQE